VELANEGFRAIFGGRELVGKTYRQAVPRLEGQPFFGLLNEVYRTGETYYGVNQPITLTFAATVFILALHLITCHGIGPALRHSEV